MFCGNCGKQNPDEAKFCSGCGSALNSVPAQQTAPVHQASTVQQPAPKKNNLLKRILIGIVAFFVASGVGTVAAGLFSSLPDVEPSGTPSQAYSQVFLNNGIAVPGSDFAGQGLKTASYAKELGDGMVENMEYVYEDGCVLVFVDAMYVPVYDLDADTRAALNDAMEGQLSAYTSLGCCQLSSYEEDGFYVYKLIFTDLDQKENVQQLSRTGMINLPEGESQVDRLGIKLTEDGLLASGFVKR